MEKLIQFIVSKKEEIFLPAKSNKKNHPPLTINSYSVWHKMFQNALELSQILS